MKFSLGLLILLMIAGCYSYPKEHIGLYSINMLYACECPQYKIFKVIDLKDENNNFILDSQDQYVKAEIDRAVNTRVNDRTQLVGRDISFEFKNSQDENSFTSEVGHSPICYYYYTIGHFKTANTFIVDEFKLTLKSDDCISKIEW